MNKLCVFFNERGFVAVHSDEEYRFLTNPPRRVGDHAEIVVKGKRILVMLLKSAKMLRNSFYLVSTSKLTRIQHTKQ